MADTDKFEANTRSMIDAWIIAKADAIGWPGTEVEVAAIIKAEAANELRRAELRRAEARSIAAEQAYFKRKWKLE